MADRNFSFHGRKSTMGRAAKVKLPREIIIRGNARMWYQLFKAMSRREFLEYPEKVRSFDDMSMAEYYAWRRVRDARDNDKVWETIQKVTEGLPAVQGTIQQGKVHCLYDAGLDTLNNPNQTFEEEEESGKVKRAKRATIKNINGGTEKMLELQTKDGKTIVSFMGKDYEVEPTQKTILIDGVNFTIVAPEVKDVDEKKPEKNTK